MCHASPAVTLICAFILAQFWPECKRKQAKIIRFRPKKRPEPDYQLPTKPCCWTCVCSGPPNAGGSTSQNRFLGLIIRNSVNITQRLRYVLVEHTECYLPAEKVGKKSLSLIVINRGTFCSAHSWSYPLRAKCAKNLLNPPLWPPLTQRQLF